MATVNVSAKLSEAIGVLRARDGLDIPFPDASGIVAFSIRHEGWSVELFVRAIDESDMVSIVCPVGKIRATAAVDFVARPLLIANLMGTQTNGLSLALNPDDDSVLLGYSIFGKNLDTDALEEVLGRFVVAGRAWKEQLDAQGPG